MAITLRSAREIELIRSAGAIVADVLSKLQKMAKPGVTTAQLDAVALEMTTQAGAQALFKGVRNPQTRTVFPGAICASINEQVVHGIPSNDAVLKEGDILSLDFGVRLNGYCGDAAVTVAIADISPQRRRLMDVTKQVLELAIAACAPSVRWSSVAGKMQQYAEAAGFSVVKDFVGHGIGTEMHEEPRVPNFVSSELLANDFVLERGMVLAVEPMINAGGEEVRTLKNGWTVVTRDSSCSAHFEHTIVIIDEGCEVLTVK
ncbi:MAG TPA: type I methionyl aminopeptidase [Sedimentisphaerales bacterium]|nr:type I methionyl aminopeptidase [Sedimentisphaerales bacterium]